MNEDDLFGTLIRVLKSTDSIIDFAQDFGYINVDSIIYYDDKKKYVMRIGRGFVTFTEDRLKERVIEMIEQSIYRDKDNVLKQYGQFMLENFVYKK